MPVSTVCFHLLWDSIGCEVFETSKMTTCFRNHSLTVVTVRLLFSYRLVHMCESLSAHAACEALAAWEKFWNVQVYLFRIFWRLFIWYFSHHISQTCLGSVRMWCGSLHPRVSYLGKQPVWIPDGSLSWMAFMMYTGKTKLE